MEKTTSSGTASYIYDLAGHEVVQYGPACSPCRDEIYAGGRHLATYANSTTYFIHPDWLGTERARSSVSGAPYETCTSLPFGDWLTCSGGDPSPMHFTGKERDSESGLDNFGARYDASSMGRFMSPDPLMASARVWEPQSWNRYSYALNNPLLFVDPTGMKEVTAEQCAKDKNCVTVKVNVIYDSNSKLTPEQKDKFVKEQLQNAKDQYGNADIHLDVTFATSGSMTIDNKGNVSFTDLKEGVLNVVVSDQVTQAGSDRQEGYAVSVIPANSTNKEDLAHEMAHHFEGDTEGPTRWLAHTEPFKTLRIINGITDFNNNFDRARIRNIDSPSGWWGLNNPLASGFNGGAAWFQKSIQPTTKPQ